MRSFSFLWKLAIFAVTQGVFKSMVHLLWSKSVDKSVNVLPFLLALIYFHTEKNSSEPKCITKARMNVRLIGQMCLGQK